MGLSVSRSPATTRRPAQVHPVAVVDADERNAKKTASSRTSNGGLSSSRRDDADSPSLVPTIGDGGDISWRRFSVNPSRKKRDKSVWSKLASRILKKSHRQRVSVQSEDLENNNEKTTARCIVVDRPPKDTAAPYLPPGVGRSVSGRISCSDRELKDLTNTRNKTSENCSSEDHRTKVAIMNCDFFTFRKNN